MNTENAKVYFISGVSGVGKTSTMARLKQILPKTKYDIRDFDERGVPDGGGGEWHSNETLHWLEVAKENAKEGKTTIITGFSEPSRVAKVHKPKEHPEAHIILLSASPEVIKERLIGRYPTPESVAEINRASGVSLDEFIQNNMAHAPKMERMFAEEGLPIINTDHLSPQEVSEKIASFIQN